MVYAVIQDQLLGLHPVRVPSGPQAKLTQPQNLLLAPGAIQKFLLSFQRLSEGLLEQFSETFGQPTNRKQEFYRERCTDIWEGNVYLSLSFKIYLHHPSDVANHQRHFIAHRDVHNPTCQSPNDIMFSAWDTWYEPLLQLYVTGTMIACGRRSQEELFERMERMEKATTELLKREAALPISQRQLLAESIRIPTGREYSLKGNHILQTCALTPNDYIYR